MSLERFGLVFLSSSFGVAGQSYSNFQASTVVPAAHAGIATVNVIWPKIDTPTKHRLPNRNYGDPLSRRSSI